MISKSHSLEESTPQRRTVRSVGLVTGNSDKSCFSLVYLSICGTKTRYYSPYGLWRDPGDALVRGPSFVSVTYKVCGCHHNPVNKRWMSRVSQVAVWTHWRLSVFNTNSVVFTVVFFLICTSTCSISFHWQTSTVVCPFRHGFSQ